MFDSRGKRDRDGKSDEKQAKYGTDHPQHASRIMRRSKDVQTQKESSSEKTSRDGEADG